MKLIFGLGNPGREYEKTYHNIGFMCVDFLLKNFCENVAEKKEGKAQTYHATLQGQKVVVAKPQTYMNLSGESVLALMTKYKVSPRDVFVFVDDIDQDKGKVRFRDRGSAGTHNGLKSIVGLVGEDFNRIRIGISRNQDMNLADFVLSKIDDQSMKQIEPAIEAGVGILLEKINVK